MGIIHFKDFGLSKLDTLLKIIILKGFHCASSMKNLEAPFFGGPPRAPQKNL